MNQNIKDNEQLNRMKALMSYGLQENKQTPYSNVEYKKMGADGKIYGIVREGTKYYIKTASNKPNVVKEDFDYIGGFRNRKDYEYESYANAQKNFDLKMMSLKEAYNKPNFVVESWDIDKKENVIIEASEKMHNEIMRERQIMRNATMIAEKKGACPDCGNSPCTCSTSPNLKDAQKDNMKAEKPQTGDAKKACKDCEDAELPKEMTESKVNEAEVLGWNQNKDYMDKSHGTEIGDSAPFDDAEARNIDDGDKQVSKTGEMENGVVEGKSMHDADNQNTPAPGTGELGDNQPFDGEKGKQIDEGMAECGVPGPMGEDDEPEDGLDEPMGGDDALGDEGDVPMDDDPIDDADVEGGDDLGDELADDEMAPEEDEDVYDDDLASRVDNIEQILKNIAEKLGVSAGDVDADDYQGDDNLFDNAEGNEEPIEDEVDVEMPMESKQTKNGMPIFETANFRKVMKESGMESFKDGGRVPNGNMNKLDDFGKHPAYQKKVMELPPKDMKEFPGYYDMNDESTHSDAPYGEKIGDSAPFDLTPEKVQNAIAESIKRVLKKKSNRGQE